MISVHTHRYLRKIVGHFDSININIYFLSLNFMEAFWNGSVHQLTNILKPKTQKFNQFYFYFLLHG
jgi:hypothetical protein